MRLKSIVARVALAAMAISMSGGTAKAQIPPPAAGAWLPTLYLDTRDPSPTEKWIADAWNAHSGIKPVVGKGMPLIYRIFSIVPDTRTIVGIGYGADCDTAANGSGAALEPTMCKLVAITLYANGTANSRSTRPGCFLWVGPKATPTSPDPVKNATYLRLDPQTGAIQAITAIDGKPVPNCKGNIHV
jgi:hypothetical protein